MRFEIGPNVDPQNDVDDSDDDKRNESKETHDDQIGNVFSKFEGASYEFLVKITFSVNYEGVCDKHAGEKPN